MEFLPDNGHARACEFRRDHEQETTPEPHSGIQGEGGFGRREGGEHARRTGEESDVHPDQITQWKAQLFDGAAGVFGKDKSEAAASSVDFKSLHAKIGELTLENDFLEGALTKAGLLSAKR